MRCCAHCARWHAPRRQLQAGQQSRPGCCADICVGATVRVCRFGRLHLIGLVKCCPPRFPPQDLFALAAVLRAYPRTPLRSLDLSYNNLVGVAGQCLLRHINRLLLPQHPEPLDLTQLAATVWSGSFSQQQPGDLGFEPGPGDGGGGGRRNVSYNGVVEGVGGGGRGLAAGGAGGMSRGRNRSGSGAPPGEGGGGGKALVPILKTSVSRGRHVSGSGALPTQQPQQQGGAGAGGGTHRGGVPSLSGTPGPAGQWSMSGAQEGSPPRRITINTGGGVATGGGAGGRTAPGSLPLPGMGYGTGGAALRQRSPSARSLFVASTAGPAGTAGYGYGDAGGVSSSYGGPGGGGLTGLDKWRARAAAAAANGVKGQEAGSSSGFTCVLEHCALVPDLGAGECPKVRADGVAVQPGPGGKQEEVEEDKRDSDRARDRDREAAHGRGRNPRERAREVEQERGSQPGGGQEQARQGTAEEQREERVAARRQQETAALVAKYGEHAFYACSLDLRTELPDRWGQGGGLDWFSWY